MKKPLIQPIVEFLPCWAETSRSRTNPVLFFPNHDDGRDHQYLLGVKEALQSTHGIYVFYNSQGRALYAGRALDQSLSDEMNDANVRERGPSQTIWRVSDPLTRQREFDRSQRRRVHREAVPLSELAECVSAYEVRNDLICDVEALMVRAFANDLLNVRMETSSHERAPGEQA